MSYAEYGSRIFFAGINAKLQVDQKDGFGHRLKMIESCSDIRAWSSDPIENNRYFREITEQGNNIGAAIIMPNIALEETKVNDTEKDSKNLKQKLTKYGVSNYTHEPKRKLKKEHYHGVIINEDWNVMDCVFQQLYKLIDYKKAIFGKSGTILPGIKKNNHQHNSKLNNRKNSNVPKSITNHDNRKLIDNETKSKTDISVSLSSNSFPPENIESEPFSEEVKSKDDNVMFKNKNYENDNDDSNDINGSQLSDTFSESEHSSISEKESMISALKQKKKKSFKAKDVKISQLRKENSELKLCLKNYYSQIKNLSDNHQNIIDLQKLLTQSHEELNELKNEVTNGRKIIDQLRKNLEEKKEECDIQNQQLNNLKCNTIDIISIKSERDSLTNIFKEITKLLENAGYYNQHLEHDIKNLLSNHKELITLKKDLEVNCSEKETEIVKLYGIIDQIYVQSESQTMTINKLNKDIEHKMNLLNQHEEKIALLTKQCQEKLEIEKSFYENELIDKDCDQALAKYFQQSLEKLNDLTNALKDAGDDVQKRKRDINKLKKQMKENIQVFKNQFKKKNKENNFYRFRYEECQKIISQQIEDIENLKRVIDELERKLIYKMELSVSELHQEHNNLTKKIQNLTSGIHERNIKIEELDHEKVNLLNQIDYTSVQLEEKNRKIKVLKENNSILAEKIDDSKKYIEYFSNAVQSMRFQMEKIYQVSLVDKKITLDENNRRIDISIMDSKDFPYQYSNNVVEDNVINIPNRTESFEYKLSSIKDGINIGSNEFNANADIKNSSENLSSQVKEKSNSCKNIYENEVKIGEKMSDQINESGDEIKDDNVQKTKSRFNVFSPKNEDFNFLSDKKGITYQNVFKKQSHYYSEAMKSYYGSNISSKNLETQSLDDKNGILNETLDFSSKIKNLKQHNSDNDKRIISKQYNNMETKSNERSTIKELKKFESSSCQQFILHCSKRFSDEKYG